MLAALTRVWPVHARPAVPSTLQGYASSTLAGLINGARQQAIADGVRPVPAQVYRSMLGYFPAALLQKCRFATGRPPALDVPALGLSYGDPTAIALADIVLFKTQRAADADLKVWAHQLTHVMQYQRWGLEGFAQRYVHDCAAVEQEATDNASRFAEWCKRQSAPRG